MREGVAKNDRPELGVKLYIIDEICVKYVRTKITQVKTDSRST